MFIDADIEFQVEDDIKLIAHNKDVAVGAYPKKGVNWQRIRESVRQKDTAYDDKQIASFGSDYAINFKFINREQKQIAIENGLIRLHDGATGFMMIKRNTLEKMFAAFPSTKYTDDVSFLRPEENRFAYALFDCGVEDDHYYSEDWMFCSRWTKMGGEIWVDISINLVHIGIERYNGSYLTQLVNPAAKPEILSFSP